MREAKDYIMIAIGMISYAVGWTVFLLPNDITTGGVPGIASIVYWATGIPVQYTYFTLNALLLLLALKILGFKFCVKTIFAVFFLTFTVSVMQQITAGMTILHSQPFMACVLGASFCGAGIGIGKIGGSAMEAIGRQPEASSDIRSNMIVAAALVEGAAFLAIIVAILALFV